jgi:hypothetical protein
MAVASSIGTLSPPWSTDFSFFRNSLDCVIKSIKAEGVPVLFRGLTLIYLRRAPHLVITFLSFEQMRAWADKFL